MPRDDVAMIEALEEVLAMRASTRIEDFQFEARVVITCCCRRVLSIGPNAISGDCWHCGRVYLTEVKVMERDPADV